MKKYLSFFVILFVSINFYAQGKFQFYGANKMKQELSFKLVNNLIVIPLQVNGYKLSFILDTGVNKTILFNLTENDSIGLNNVKKVSIKGLGVGKGVEALLSEGNNFRIKNIFGSNQDLYVILKDAFNLSAKMGTTIHGIIGYDLLKDVVVKINYNSKKLTFYNPDKFKKLKCKKCEVLPLQFYRNKPYIDVKIQIDSTRNITTPVKLLIDTGGSDAMWLFEGTKKELKTPKKYFRDILGEGLSGTIYGNRSRVKQLSLGKFIVREPTVSFLDSSSTFNARRFKQRNGSIGGSILKRFKLWIDYSNKTITFKKNASLKKGFYYNMSGMHIIYDGQELVKEKLPSMIGTYSGIKINKNDIISFVSTYSYRFKPKYKIEKIVDGSPADIAGLLEGDIITSINGKNSYEYQLSEIMELFQTKPNKKITIKVKRGITILKYVFRLKKRI